MVITEATILDENSKSQDGTACQRVPYYRNNPNINTKIRAYNGQTDSTRVVVYFETVSLKTGDATDRENNQTAAASRIGHRSPETSLTWEKTARRQRPAIAYTDFFALYTIITLI